MRPNGKLGVAFFLVGTVLILSALSLFAYNHIEDSRAGKFSESLMQQLKDTPILPDEPISGNVETVDGTEYLPEPPAESQPENESLEMREVEIDGYSYIGYISIPSLDLELPIMSEWDYTRLKIAPCRQKGSTKTDDLVVLAHNYKKHFGPLRRLSHGDEIIITDMDGEEIHYTVSRLEKISPKNPGAILESDSDLVLYTCTSGGKLRLTVFCERCK